MSERRACRVVAQWRTTQRRRPAGRLLDDPVVEERMLALADANPSCGLPRLHRLLRQDGDRINHKRSARLYATHQLWQCRRRRRRLPDRPRQTSAQPVRPNQWWSLDFMSDGLARGRAFPTLNVIDDFARDALAIAIDFSLASGRVTRELDQLCEVYGTLERIRSDNGPELTSHETQDWALRRGITWEFIKSGCLAQRPTLSASTARAASRSWTRTASRRWPMSAPRPRAGCRSTSSNEYTAPSVNCRRACSSSDGSIGKTRSNLYFQVDALKGYGPSVYRFFMSVLRLGDGLY